MNNSPANQDLWVFGYGSLMWRPGFDHVERMEATLHGYHRALCILSVHHRGSVDRPGLVLGLDKGGSCRGIAFRVPAQQAEKTLVYLREREQVTSVYLETRHHLRLADGRLVEATAFTADRTHPQFARSLSHTELVARVRHGVGVSGNNPDYVRATVAELSRIGIRDRTLNKLLAALDQENGPT
jgi:glutathione-specific gamma-glutamylcyclotransferase